MPNTFEYAEYVGLSTISVEDAIAQAVKAASETRTIAWFELVSTRGRIDQQGAIEYQVTVKFGCK